METEFKHSIKVPMQYKKAAKVLKNSMQSGASVKGQIFSEKHAVRIFENQTVEFQNYLNMNWKLIKNGHLKLFFQKTNRLYALITKFSKNKETIDYLLDQSQILEKENRLDKYLCYVLVTELMFGAKKLNGESKPVLCVSAYEDRFNDILKDMNNETQSSDSQLLKGKPLQSIEL